MARPLSEAKRQALLNAAANLVAAMGVGAPTAKIAQAAGVSEGALFTYFPTKEDLLNQLFVEIEASLADAMGVPYPTGLGPRERFRLVWDRLVDWGTANPVARRAVRQLKVSGRLSHESSGCSETLFKDTRKVVNECLDGHADPARVTFYVETILFGVVEIVIEAITARPQDRESISAAGFDLFWRGIAV